MNDSALTTMEHHLARSRVGLSIAALISVYIHDGRLPNDQGFDEWFGIPRTTLRWFLG